MFTSGAGPIDQEQLLDIIIRADRGQPIPDGYEVRTPAMSEDPYHSYIEVRTPNGETITVPKDLVEDYAKSKDITLSGNTIITGKPLTHKPGPSSTTFDELLNLGHILSRPFKPISVLTESFLHINAT